MSMKARTQGMNKSQPWTAWCLGEGAEGVGAHDGVRDLAVLVHARAAVAVELAEVDAVVVLVQERVHAGEGQHRVVVAGQQYELHEALVEIEQLAVLLVGPVALDHLAEDAVARLGRALHDLVGSAVEQARHEGGGHHLVVHDGRGVLHVVERGAAALDVAVQLVDDLEVLAGVIGIAWHEGSVPWAFVHLAKCSTTAAKRGQRVGKPLAADEVTA